MTVKEYANKMGLTVNGLCEVTGMSRMGLNNILVKGCRAEHLWKRREAVDRLTGAIMADYEKKVHQTKQEYVERMKMLDMFYNE